MQRALSVLSGAHSSLSIRTANSLFPVAAPAFLVQNGGAVCISDAATQTSARFQERRARANAPTASAASGRMSDDGSTGRVL